MLNSWVEGQGILLVIHVSQALVLGMSSGTLVWMQHPVEKLMQASEPG